MIRAYLQALFLSDDPAPMWSAAIISLSVGSGCSLAWLVGVL